MRTAILALCLVLLSGTAYADAVFFNAGPTQDTSTDTTRLQWSVSYLHDLSNHTAFSLSYVNEGHQHANHRDGISGQFWLRTGLIGPQMRFGLGAGPYVYFDTHIHGDDSHHDLHGLAARFSAAATWYGLSPFLLQARVNYLVANQSFDTLSATIGLGYDLGRPEERAAGAGQRSRGEFALLGGQAVLNSARSERRVAWGAEYHAHLLRHLDWSLTGLWEGNKAPLNRYGIAGQLWLAERFFDDRLSLAAGFGPYLAYDKYRESGGGVTKIEGDASLRASLRVMGNVAVVASWSRIFSTHDRDSDVFLAGLAYRFGR